jgi:hypothetical protein
MSLPILFKPGFNIDHLQNVGVGPQGAVEVGRGDAGPLVDEGEDEVLLAVGEEVALVATGVAEEGASGEVVAVVGVSGEADSGAHEKFAEYCMYISRFECLDLARNSRKPVCPFVHHGNGLQKAYKYGVRQQKEPYLRQLS